MENIFEEARFGDLFITRDDRLAVYLNNKHELYIKDYGSVTVNNEGKVYNVAEECNDDIVKKYNVGFSESELDNLAKSIYINLLGNNKDAELCIAAFKSGYNFAKPF